MFEHGRTWFVFRSAVTAQVLVVGRPSPVSIGRRRRWAGCLDLIAMERTDASALRFTTLLLLTLLAWLAVEPAHAVQVVYVCQTGSDGTSKLSGPTTTCTHATHGGNGSAGNQGKYGGDAAGVSRVYSQLKCTEYAGRKLAGCDQIDAARTIEDPIPKPEPIWGVISSYARSDSGKFESLVRAWNSALAELLSCYNDASYDPVECEQRFTRRLRGVDGLLTFPAARDRWNLGVSQLEESSAQARELTGQAGGDSDFIAMVARREDTLQTLPMRQEGNFNPFHRARHEVQSKKACRLLLMAIEWCRHEAQGGERHRLFSHP